MFERKNSPVILEVLISGEGCDYDPQKICYLSWKNNNEGTLLPPLTSVAVQ